MNVAKPVSIPRDGADDPMISAVAARRLIRAGIHSGHTAGVLNFLPPQSKALPRRSDDGAWGSETPRHGPGC
jgi:hypothetical protein